MSCLRLLYKEPNEYRTVVLDTIGGLDSMVHEHECVENYKGDWSNKGFMSFQTGYKSAMTWWESLVYRALDTLHFKGMTIVMLCHLDSVEWKNPLGSDYSKYTLAVNARHTMPLIERWADYILIGQWDTMIQEPDPERKFARAKVTGGTRRILCTQPRAGMDIPKCKVTLPPDMVMGDTPEDSYAILYAALGGDVETNPLYRGQNGGV